MTPFTNLSDHSDHINENLTTFLNAYRSKFGLEIIKKSEVLTITCSSKSKHHTDILDGLMPTSISTGDRSVAYVKYEILAVIAARVQGRSKDEIRLLVKNLIAQRQDLLNEVQS